MKSLNEMEIKAENYHIWYDTETDTVTCEGSLRLNGTEEYEPITELLDAVVEREPLTIVLNLQQLHFLNSSGISMLSKFAIDVRKRKNIQMKVIGSQQVPWQSKSLKNLQRLMPSLSLEWL
jgi:hypothetical protein